jgi:hypothetical protein
MGDFELGKCRLHALAAHNKLSLGALSNIDINECFREAQCMIA